LKTRKTKSIIAVIGACVLVVFSVAIFPFILAATPGNRGITTIETESYFPAEETEQADELEMLGEVEHLTEKNEQADELETLGEAEQLIEAETIPNINAITKEQAIAIASESLGPKVETYYSNSGTSATVSIDFLEAKYMETPDPLRDPSWYVLFAKHSSGTSISHVPPEGITPEEYLQKILDDPLLSNGSDLIIGTDNNGYPVIIDHFSRTLYVVVEVNALTGEYILYGSTLDDDISLDFFTCADDIKQVFIYPGTGSWLPEPAG